MVCPWMGEEVLPVEEIPVHESPLVPYEEQPPASASIAHSDEVGRGLLRNNLDEKGGGRSEF